MINIIISPPDEGRDVPTDEDSDKSDGEAEGDPLHLPRRLLQAEVILPPQQEFEEEEQQPSTSRESPKKRDSPHSTSGRIRSKRKKLQADMVVSSEEEPQPSTTRERPQKKKDPHPSTSRRIQAKRKLQAEIIVSSEPDSGEEPQPTTSGKKKQKRRQTADEDFLPWTKNPDEVQFSLPYFVQKPLEPTFSPTQTPFQSFSTFFSNELLNLLVSETNLYASSKGFHGIPFNEEEIYCFVGILLFSGYHKLPRKRMFWNTDADCNVEMVRNAMRRNRFDEAMRYIHLVDNNKIDGTDKLFKVRPLFDIINKNFKKIPPQKNVSVDESIIPYYGHHGCKQFIRGKPIRFGFKLWCLADTSGFLQHAEPYAGAHTKIDATGLGQGADVVLGLAQKSDLAVGSKLFFDNFFTSEKLMKKLTERGLGGTGTLRENRVNYQTLPLQDKRSFSREVRGKSQIISNGKLNLVRWNDNNVVTVLTNCVHGGPKSASRYSSSEKKRISVQMPLAISEYNTHMGGIDLFDEFISTYRIGIRSKKWWWPYFSWAINACMVQGWLLHRRLGSSIDLLQFQRECVLYILQHYGTKASGRGPRPARTGRDELRLDRLDHLIVKGESKYKVCVTCKNRTIYLCNKCKVSLHPECFFTYHQP